VQPHLRTQRLFRIVDALDATAVVRRPDRAQLVASAANDCEDHRRARSVEQLVENIDEVGWNPSAEQVARLDAATNVPSAYPVWHQRAFPMLNEGVSARLPDRTVMAT
jgi:aryl-alcohol dehydrogenase-like predicted oxidoreductase